MTTTYVRRGPPRRKSAASAHRTHATTTSGATSERDEGQRARRDRAADRDWAPCLSREDRDPPLPPLPPSSVCDTVRAKPGLEGAPGGGAPPPGRIIVHAPGASPNARRGDNSRDDERFRAQVVTRASETAEPLRDVIFLASVAARGVARAHTSRRARGPQRREQYILSHRTRGGCTACLELAIFSTRARRRPPTHPHPPLSAAPPLASHLLRSPPLRG